MLFSVPLKWDITYFYLLVLHGMNDSFYLLFGLLHYNKKKKLLDMGIKK